MSAGELAQAIRSYPNRLAGVWTPKGPYQHLCRGAGKVLLLLLHTWLHDPIRYDTTTSASLSWSYSDTTR